MTHTPMHQWCPKCGAMLPAHLEECPRCGTRLKGAGADAGYTAKDIAQITSVILAFAIVPLCVILIVSIVCVSIAR